MPADRTVTTMLDVEPRTAAALAAALEGVAREFDLALRSELPPVGRLTQHVERYRGKMVRPTLAVLSAMASHPRANSLEPAAILSRDLFKAAAVCEMVHMATLVHDDVLDDAATRRRGRTVNALHGNEAAVMLGDLLLASAYELCSTLPTPEAALLVARASVVMCGGELLQLHHRGDWSLDEATYFEIVSRKTGDLIAASASIGALVVGASSAHRAVLADFARDVGIAFQVQDDLLDLEGDAAVVGKTLGRDLAKGKLTLPLIHHLAEASADLRGRSLMLLDAARSSEDRGEAVEGGADLLAALERTDSLVFARETAERLVRQAIVRLEALPDSPPRSTLAALAGAVVDRAY